jgi:lipopolysaccharide/colanic/teichoic acid biosynthesis glycosyltransferase
MGNHTRHIPFVQNIRIRATAGFILLLLSFICAGAILKKESLPITILVGTLAWLISVLLTQKYVHKYPQRYFSYLVASHLKAAAIMSVFLWGVIEVANLDRDSYEALWMGYFLFILSDFFFSIPRRGQIVGKQLSEIVQSLYSDGLAAERSSRSGQEAAAGSPVEKKAILGKIGTDVGKPLYEFIETHLPDCQAGRGDVLIFDDLPAVAGQSKVASAGLLLARTRLNDVKRLNQFLLFCADRIAIGGYFVGRYLPLETVSQKLKERYPGFIYWPIFFFHFLWYQAIPKIPWLDALYFSPLFSWVDRLYFSVAKKRNRVLSRAEVWGRLSYFGMQVIAESEMSDERYFIAQRRTIPVQGKKPSYYLIARLEKVGLDGKSIYTHKIRTMYAFSEFLQRRIFEDHGLASTGKFRNDFRLTEFGKFLRKYWLDELPQVFDWLRGDVKLVGIRATSRHFLSLYPRNFLELYVQVKPGLIPPIFSESTNGFAQIVEVELTYLQHYWAQPLRTDVRYLVQTFNDIVFKGIRSR